MFKIYSKGCEYALNALMQIPLKHVRETFSVRKLCNEANVPEAFTRKVFQDLVKRKILAAVSGPGGGYRFARDPKDITFAEFVYAVEGENCFAKCILGLEECNNDSPCPVHTTWTNMKKKIISEMEAKTLEHLMKSVKK